jgi:hypothetical protein
VKDNAITMRSPVSLLTFAFASLIILSNSAPTPGDGIPSLWDTTATDWSPSPVLRGRASPSQDTCPNEQENCKKKCFSNTFYRKPGSCECTACGINEKANAANNGCQADPDAEKSRGKCPLGSVLDDAEGGQDHTTRKPACIPDDRVLCDSGTVPRSRNKNDKDVLDETKCAPDVEEKKKPNCPKSRYRFMTVWEEAGKNTAEIKCMFTRKFSRDKSNKFDELKKSKQPEYEKKKKERDDARKKWTDSLKKQAEDDVKDRKRHRIPRCILLTVVATFSGDVLMEYAQDFFDEDLFVSDEAIKKYWPSDLEDIPMDSRDVDSDEYLQEFGDVVSEGGGITERVKPHKRAYARPIVHTRSPRADVAVVLSPTTALMSIHEKRGLGEIFAAIARFLVKLGQFLAKAGSQVARLARLTKNGGPRMAKSGKSKAKSKKEQEDVADEMSKSKQYGQCLRGQAPVKK